MEKYKNPNDLSQKLSNPTDYNMSAHPYNKYIEFVNTNFLDKFKEYDREEDYHPGQEYLNNLTEHIKQYGFEEPLIVGFNPKTGYTRLIEGNHRLAAAKRLGIGDVPVRMLRRPYMEEDPKGKHGGGYVDVEKAPALPGILKKYPDWQEMFNYYPFQEDIKPSDWFADNNMIRQFQKIENAKYDYDAPDSWYNWRWNH